MRSTTWRVGGLLFGSGLCALVYQVGWLREFRLIFGASTAASAAVLAIFIGGLGAGGLLLGPRADRHPRPLLFYAQLETHRRRCPRRRRPFLLDLARAIYLASGGSPALGAAARHRRAAVVDVLVLAVPMLAMGGTLPAAARSVDARRSMSAGATVSALYALNTLGAVAGCLRRHVFAAGNARDAHDDVARRGAQCAHGDGGAPSIAALAAVSPAAPGAEPAGAPGLCRPWRPQWRPSPVTQSPTPP